MLKQLWFLLTIAPHFILMVLPDHDNVACRDVLMHFATATDMEYLTF